MKLLLTGFEPFAGDTVNPALEAVKALPERIGSVQIVKLAVPTVFRESIDLVTQAIARIHPDAVLCVGQAGGRAQITPERVAINLDDAPVPDNKGSQPVDTPIFPDGDSAYFATLPIKAMVRAIREAGIPAAVSNTAGTYVCNHLMYGVLYTLAKKHPGVKGGFVHVPFLPEQASLRNPPAPSLTMAEILTGLTAAISAIGKEQPNLSTAEGAIC